MKWKADVTLALSVLLYALTWQYDLYLSAYPNGFWAFKSARLAIAVRVRRLVRARRRPANVADPVVAGHEWISIAYLLPHSFVTLTWYVPQLSHLMPRSLDQWMYPIDKTDLDVLRFAHFWRWPRLLCASCQGLAGTEIALVRPLIVCGQHSLRYSASVFSWRLRDISCWPRFLAVRTARADQCLRDPHHVGMASVISWYKHSADKSASRTKGTGGNADLAGGGA